VALSPACARLWTAFKIGRLKLAGTSGLNTPEETSTKMLVSFSFTAMTPSTGEEAAMLQSGQLACAAAKSRTLTSGELAGCTCTVATDLTTEA
jgi:hypothetical protein